LLANVFPEMARALQLLQSITTKSHKEGRMEQKAKTHPVLIVAGVAVTLFSLLGAAAVTGILPSANSRSGESSFLPQPAPAATAPAPASRTLAQAGTAAQAKPRTPVKAQAQASCTNCGVIESIRAVEVKEKTSGLGAVAGGVAGGLLGNQIGSGGTRTVLTVGGDAGGAFAGDAVEGHLKKHTVWRVTVRLEDGSVRTVSQRAQPAFASGDRVRVLDGGMLERA
jgi:outer membrane lipoprotein SlyB